MQAPADRSLPVLGHFPTNGIRYARSMTRSGKKTRKYDASHPPPRIVTTLAGNVEKLLRYAEKHEELADRRNDTALQNYMRAQVDAQGKPWPDSASKSTIHRIRRMETAASIDVVELIARSYPGIEAWHLLLPDFNPEDPPVIAEGPLKQLFKDFMRDLQESSRTLYREERARRPAGDDRDHASATPSQVDLGATGRGKGRRRTTTKTKTKKGRV